MIPEGGRKRKTIPSGTRVESLPFKKRTKVRTVDDEDLAGSWEGGTKGSRGPSSSLKKLVKGAKCRAGMRVEGDPKEVVKETNTERQSSLRSFQREL